MGRGKAIGPGCARPRAQQRPKAVESRNSPACRAGRSLLRPRTSALRSRWQPRPECRYGGCCRYLAGRSAGWSRLWPLDGGEPAAPHLRRQDRNQRWGQTVGRGFLICHQANLWSDTFIEPSPCKEELSVTSFDAGCENKCASPYIGERFGENSVGGKWLISAVLRIPLTLSGRRKGWLGGETISLNCCKWLQSTGLSFGRSGTVEWDTTPNAQIADGGPSAAPELVERVAGPPFGEAPC
jgi:hypothetical protein